MLIGARLSHCRQYRYLVWRIWDEARPKVLFIGLNPSTEGESDDNPTITRCVNFAKQWGYGGIYLANLFAYRAQTPSELLKAKKPIGYKNKKWLFAACQKSELHIACWGNDGKHLGQSAKVIGIIPNLYCLRINKGGEAAHPLYLPKTVLPIPYNFLDDNSSTITALSPRLYSL